MIRIYTRLCKAATSEFYKEIPEKVMEITFPFKKTFWDVHQDTIVTRRPKLMLAWYSIPCSNIGFRLRGGLI